MAIDMGHRFPVPFDEAFPYGAYVVGEVVEAKDYDANGKASPKRDKATGERVYEVRFQDGDPSLRKGEFKAKIAAKQQPVPPEAVAGTPFRPVEFVGLTVTPYVDNNTKRLAWSFWAEGMRAPQAGKSAGKSSSGSPGSQSAAA